MFDSKRNVSSLALIAAAALLFAPPVSIEASEMSATHPAAAPATTAAVASGGLWTAVAASGPVETRGPNPMFSGWEKVSRGMAMEPLSVVRTGKRGRTTLTRDGSVILVAAGSELILPAGQTTNTLVRQTSGSAVYDIAPQDSGRFKVETPFLVAGVKGTVFSIIVDNGFTAVTVDEGTVEVNPFGTDRRVDLNAGDMALMDGRGAGFEVFRESDREMKGAPDRVRVARKMSRRLAMTAERERDRMERRGDLLDNDRERETGRLNGEKAKNDNDPGSKREMIRDDDDEDPDDDFNSNGPKGKKGKPKGTPNQP